MSPDQEMNTLKFLISVISLDKLHIVFNISIFIKCRYYIKLYNCIISSLNENKIFHFKHLCMYNRDGHVRGFSFRSFIVRELLISFFSIVKKNEFFRSQNDCSFSSISFVPSVKKNHCFLKEIFENIVRSVKKRLFFINISENSFRKNYRFSS